MSNKFGITIPVNADKIQALVTSDSANSKLTQKVSNILVKYKNNIYTYRNTQCFNLKENTFIQMFQELKKFDHTLKASSFLTIRNMDEVYQWNNTPGKSRKIVEIKYECFLKSLND